LFRWGLIPFWTKREPDFATITRTINCRDDSLLEDRGMWISMKRKKRCIVPVMGYYEWLKKSPKERIPYFTKRADGKIMLLAGLWDSVQYEGTAVSLGYELI
jgi:putative SOS response-associated peptidase YedK